MNLEYVVVACFTRLEYDSARETAGDDISESSVIASGGDPIVMNVAYLISGDY